LRRLHAVHRNTPTASYGVRRHERSLNAHLIEARRERGDGDKATPLPLLSMSRGATRALALAALLAAAAAPGPAAPTRRLQAKKCVDRRGWAAGRKR
jgi:hypothetical protein